MKRLLLILFLVLFFNNVQAQDDFYLLLNSNINYAPFGVGLILGESNENISYFINVKFSEDYFTRKLSTKENQRFNESRVFDIDETVATLGIIKPINNEIDICLGIGFLTGKTYQPKYNDNEIWFPVNKSSNMSPVFSCGLGCNINRIKFLLGYEVAFVNPKDYPIQVLNVNSVGRLSSATFGIAYNLIGEN